MENKDYNNIIVIGITILLIIILVITLILSNSPNNTTYVSLERNISEIYRWKYKIDNKEIVNFIEKKSNEKTEGKKTDGIITDIYYFKGKKPGKTSIRFTLTNKNNGSYLDMKHYTITVDKNLKITIEEKSNQ